MWGREGPTAAEAADTDEAVFALDVDIILSTSDCTARVISAASYINRWLVLLVVCFFFFSFSFF